MPFDLSFPTTDGNPDNLQLEPGEALYILGANGTGKSSLLQHFNRHNDPSRWISAHRQTWLASDAPNMTTANKIQAEDNMRRYDNEAEARYRDGAAQGRTSIALHNLILSGNSRARDIAEKMDEGNLEEAQRLSAKQRAPITIINDIFKRSNLPVHLRIDEDERLMARKGRDGAEYGASEMSDGERNALLIAANVLTAPPGSLLLIDEPERHLHRSIATPLLTHLFEKREDCGFVISTHDIELPMTPPEARVLLLRECSFEQNNAQHWAADKLEPGAEIDEGLKRDVLGARRKILFVEGNNNSLDKRLYGCVFPSVTVIPKGNCVDVERAMKGLKSGVELHWLEACGIVDGDGLDDNEIAENRKQEGVYTLPYYSVEAIYYHPKMIRKIAAIKAKEFSSDANELDKKAIAAGIAAVTKNKDHLSKNKAKRIANKNLMDKLPSDDALLADFNQTINVDGPEIHRKVKDDLECAVKAGNWEEILRICPIRESGAKDEIAKALHYRKAADYEKAVIVMLRQDEEAANFVRGLFGDLADLLSDSEARQQENAT